MILLIHIIIALASVAFTTYLFFKPSDTKLHISYGLVVGTIASGCYLVWAQPAHMLQACTSGLLYVTAVTIGIAGARRRLASQKTDK